MVADGTWAPSTGITFYPYPTGDGEVIPSTASKYFRGFTHKNEVFGGLSFGVGNPSISQHLSATVSLTFGAIGAQSASGQFVTVTGASAGDTVVVTNDSGTYPAGGVLQAIVNSTNTVLVVWVNASAATITPGTANYRVDVWKH